jgi:hypothetical protein
MDMSELVGDSIDPRMGETLRTSKVFPAVVFILTDTAIIGTRLTLGQMALAGWFSKRPPVAIVQNGESVSFG